MPLKRLELVYNGRLQEVDFRATAERFATARNLTGYVSKFPNGNVKIVVEGEEKELQNFLRDFNDDMDIFIEHYSRHWFEPTNEYPDFRFLNI
jgi:acylphosphatase